VCARERRLPGNQALIALTNQLMHVIHGLKLARFNQLWHGDLIDKYDTCRVSYMHVVSLRIAFDLYNG